MKPRSLAWRLAWRVALLGLLLAVAVLGFSVVTLSRELDARQRLVLRDKVEQARHLLGQLDDAGAVRDQAFTLVELVSGRAELHLAVAAAQGETLVAFSPEASESLVRLRNDTWAVDSFLDWRERRDGRTMLSLAAAGATRDGSSVEVVLSVDRSADRQLLKGLLLTAAAAAPFALALVFGGALGIAAWGLRPLRRFADAASGVSTQALDARIDPAGLPAELHEPAARFNAMLDRLDDGVRRLSEFSGDLAHEIRTPLATLLGRTQVALSQPRSADQLVDLLAGNVDELQRLSRLVGDMLFLARADDAGGALDLAGFDLADEARTVADFLQPLADERGVTIAVDGSARVTADRGLVQRAIGNLLSNALRHGDPASPVRVACAEDGHGARLEVVNQGPPIAAEHLPRLFDRFYRADDPPARDPGSSGLGLAIVAAIMKLHGGAVRVENREVGGVCFGLVFATAST